MRVVSLVPSWTETLITCGATVVGRTRFCVHPEDLIGTVSVVGGTKDFNLEKLIEVRPELLILDREENTREMYDLLLASLPQTVILVSHVTAIESMSRDLGRLAAILASHDEHVVARKILGLAGRWKAIEKRSMVSGQRGAWPGVLEWIREPQGVSREVVYVIWRDPWMSAGPETFIASVLTKLGFHVAAPTSKARPAATRYPEFDIADLDPKTILFFATEPFPFQKFREELAKLPYPCALVDGECFSWFGIRSLRFLEENLER